MARLIDLTGQRFGRLTVMARAENSHRDEARWRCVCVYGKETVVRGSDLRCGDTRSCGCLARERRAERKCQKCGTYQDLDQYQGKRGRVCLTC